MATLDKIYNEIKALRKEVEIFIPRETLSGYAHPQKIISSYKKAIAKYPNLSQRHAGHQNR